MVKTAGFENYLFEPLQEPELGDRGRIEAVHDVVFGEVIKQRLFDRRVIVAVVEGTSAGKEVQVSVAVNVPDAATASGGERRGPYPAVGANFGFEAFDRLMGHQGVQGILFVSRMVSYAS